MAVPLDAIRAIHNAFRQDLQTMDAAAYAAARGEGGLETVSQRYGFFNEVLVIHAAGEEEFVFPAVEKVAPLVAEAYEKDHRGLDSLFDRLDRAMKTGDVLTIARATAVFNFHLSFHLGKEEAHLYRIFNERIALADQGPIIGNMSRKVPPERFPELVRWLFPLIGPDDRENMTRIWRQTLPEPAFANLTKLIRATIGPDWQELARRIPELNSVS